MNRAMASFEFLGPYRIEELIGRGGMGSVYRARHEKTGELVAVKLISQHVADEARFRRRFAAEVEMLKRLRHRNIVRLIGYGEQEGQLFYSMELVEGESLQQRIRRLKRLDWLATIDIAIEVASALKHAHDIGVIHRDLKPANLVLTDGGAVKLVDFGIAKLFGFGEQTMAGSVLGTADYMAPEQASEEPITPRTDLYALGSVMYAMLTGRPPFTGKKVTEVIESLRRDRPVPLDLINPDIPEALVELVHHLLEKEPADRPPTALAVMNRLKAMRSGLQRAQTASIESLPTQAGDSDSSPTGESVSADQAQLPPGATDSSRNNATIDVHRENESAAAASGGGVADHQTIASQNTAPSPEPPEVANAADATPASPKSHFQTVADSPGHHGSLFGRQVDEHYWWVQAVSIALMILILLGGAALFYRAIQTPAADTLYDQIIQAEQQGDPLEAQPEIRQFLDAYADDPRAEELRELNQRIDLQRFLRRMEAEANRVGGVAGLGAAEQAFLEAMRMRHGNPPAAREKLQHWLNVFQPSGNGLAAKGNLRTRRMAKMAEQEIARLADLEPVETIDPRVQELLDQIAAAQQELPPEQQRRVAEGILELYGESAWAEPARERARQMLEMLAGDATAEAAPKEGAPAEQP